MLTEWQKRGDHLRWEWRLLAKDGSERFVEWSNISGRYPIPGWSSWGIGMDVTERRQAEMALAVSEERFRDLVESSQDWIWEVNAKGVYTYSNPRCRELLGYEPEEIIGRMPFELMAEDEADRVRTDFLLSIRNNVAIIALENINRHKQGHTVVLETSGVPFFDEHGELAGYRGMDRDITQHKASEVALRESEARYRVVFDQQFQFMAILSPDGVTMDINELPLRMTGTRREDYLGKPIWLTPAWEGSGRMAPDLAQAAYRGGPTQRAGPDPGPLPNLGGEIRNSDAATSAIHDAQGEVIFYLIQATDTTEHHHVEQERSKLLVEIQQLNEDLEHRVRQRTSELRTANKELESFSYSLSHDLRAPFRAIDGFSLALLEDYGDQLDATAHDYLQRVRGGAQRMGILIDDLLQLSRVSRSQLTLTEVDLGELALAVLDELKAGEPERQVDFSVGEDLQVQGDARLLKVMLDNLLGNAWKFTSRESRARIAFHRQKENPRVFTIVDNGVGFDMRYADKLFGAFQPLHRVSDFPGTGVGLATVQRIVHRHGGRIWAEAQEDKKAANRDKNLFGSNKRPQGQ